MSVGFLRRFQDSESSRSGSKCVGQTKKYSRSPARLLSMMWKAVRENDMSSWVVRSMQLSASLINELTFTSSTAVTWSS